MISQKISKKTLSDDEDDSDLIINNDDFWEQIDLKSNSKIKETENNNYNSNQNEIISHNKSSSTKTLDNSNTNIVNLKIPIELKKEILSMEFSNNINNNILINTNNCNNNKNNNNEIKNIKLYSDNIINENEEYNDEKTIFSKIAEDLYMDNKNSLKPGKKDIDISKEKEDNYNKLTVENYLFTCADKENSKNNKKIKEFIERKNKEQICKIIGIEMKKNNKENDNFKRLSSDHKKMKRPKGARSPQKFLDDQKFLDEKHKMLISNLIKMHDDEINLCIQDRPTITKNSERLAKLNKANKDVHLKLYEDFNLKKKIQEEKNKNKTFKNNINIIGSKKLNKVIITENSKRLFKEYEKKKILINENEIKQLNDIKNLSAASLIDKTSNDIVTKKLIKIYKDTLKSIFDKDISDKFDINYNDYLTFIYELGLLDKNNNNYIKERNNVKISLNITLNSSENNEEEKNKENNFEIKRKKSFNIKTNNINIDDLNKRNTNLNSKSVGIKSNENATNKKAIKESWKIVTKNKIFNKKDLAPSKRVLLFFLSLCGIYKGNIDNFIKKEFPFLSEDKESIFDSSLSKQIYKYFYLFRNTIIDNILKNKDSKKKDIETKNVEYKKKLKKGSKSFIRINDNNNNISQENNNIKADNNSKTLINSISNKGYDLLQKMKYNFINNKKNININSSQAIEKLNKIPNRKRRRRNSINKVKTSITERNTKNNSNNITTTRNEIIDDNNINNPFKQKMNMNKKKNRIKFNDNKSLYELQMKKNNNYLNQNFLIINNQQNPEQRNHSNYNILKKRPLINKEEHKKEKHTNLSNYANKRVIKIKNNNGNFSNINNLEENEEFSKKLYENEKEFKINYKNEISTPQNCSEGNSHSSKKKKKNEFIYKIKLKDKLKKLVINKRDNIELKIDNFCKENHLDDDDKQQILEIFNLKFQE